MVLSIIDKVSTNTSPQCTSSFDIEHRENPIIVVSVGLSSTNLCGEAKDNDQVGAEEILMKEVFSYHCIRSG